MDTKFYRKYKKYKSMYKNIGGSQSTNIEQSLKDNLEVSKRLVASNKLDITDSEIKSLLSYVKFQRISGDTLLDIVNFNKGCMDIALWLNSVYTKSGTREKIPVVCPGDSPAKIVRFLQLSNLIDPSKFEFISFSLSGMVDYYEHYNMTGSSCYDDDICEYIYRQLSDIVNFDNLVIMDYVARGSSVFSIIDSILCKMKDITPNVRTTLNKIYIEVKKLVVFRNINKLGKTGSPVPRTYHVLNIENCLPGSIGYIMEAERYNSRCVPSNNEYKNNLQYDQQQDFNCNLFVYTTLLYNNNAAKLVRIWDSIPNIYTSKNIVQYFNKILEVQILEEGKLKYISNVFLCHLGYGGPNTVKLLECPETFIEYPNSKSTSIGSILDIKVVRDIKGFDYLNFSHIYKIHYLDIDNIERSLFAFYSYSSYHRNYLEFIKMSHLTSDLPWHNFRDTVNDIKIYPNKLLNAKLVKKLPTKQFKNVPTNCVVKISMIDGREYIGFVMDNMGWGIYLGYGPLNKSLILINNLIKDISVFKNLTCKYNDTNIRNLRSKCCKITYTNGPEHTINAMYLDYSSFDQTLHLKSNKVSGGYISINISQILKIELELDKDKCN